MKKALYFIITYVILLSSCDKGNFNGPLLASLNVTNVVIDGKSIRLGSAVRAVANNSFAQFSLTAGENSLYVWPVGDSVRPYYTNAKFNIEHLEMYSLFLSGQASNISGLLVKDNIPYHVDSTCGVRIINLCPNSKALNITLSTTPTINEISNLAYLQYVDFKTYPANAANAKYVFQLRNSADNKLLTSYTLTSPTFANVTLVIRGMVGGSPAIAVTLVTNDR
jgi:hypothetical protein